MNERRYFSMEQCATSIETLTELANKPHGARRPTYSQLELLTAHSQQITDFLRHPETQAIFNSLRKVDQ